MAQSQGSATTRRENDHSGEKKHGSLEKECHERILRTSSYSHKPPPNLQKSNTTSCLTLSQDNPTALLPKLFGPLRRRYENRPGGYTRVLRIEPLKTDQAPSAILELVDGPKDIRFAMTAATLARERLEDVGMREITSMNIKKVTQFREGGEEELERMVTSISAKKGLPVRPRRKTEEEESEEEGVEVEKHQGSYGRHVGNRRNQPRRMEERRGSILDVTDQGTRKENSRDSSHPAKPRR
jgi:hypothetical protein